MNKTICVVLLLCLAPLLTGCGLFGIGAKNYDGSEAFNQAHPEYTNTPGYMQPDPQDTGN
jgi:hypothetical protein